MKKEKTQQIAFMGMAISVMAFFSAIQGIVNENIYKEAYLTGAITKKLVLGSVAQDMITVPLSVALLFLAIALLKKPVENTLVAFMGIVAYFFYGYGLYVIQGQYTSLHLVYIVVFSLSIYTLIFAFAAYKEKEGYGGGFTDKFRTVLSAFMLLIIVVLGPLWVLMMLSDMATRFPGETYGVFVLDLCIVFPALAISLFRFYKKLPYGNLLAGVGLVKILTVCISVAFAEWYVSYSSLRPLDGFMFSLFSFLSVSCLLLLAKYFTYTRKDIADRESLI